jgi:hypothetical protein
MNHIRKFDSAVFESRGIPPVIAVVGLRAVGKTRLITDLVYHMRKIPMFICMSGNKQERKLYEKYIHPLCIHKGYKKDITDNLIKQQQRKYKKCALEGTDFRSNPDLDSGLIIDTCEFSKDLKKDIRSLVMNGRQWKIAVIVSFQSIVDISPDIRANIDYLFCFSAGIEDQRKLYENFFGCFKKFSHFQQAFEKCTGNHECLVLDNTSKSPKIENCVFYHRATLGRDYKIGSELLRNYLDSIYVKPNDDDDDDDNNDDDSLSVSSASSVSTVDHEEFIIVKV